MRRNNKGKYLIIILLLIVSIGFAFLSSRLDFNGIANVRPINWKIYFDNVQKNFGQEFEITEPSTSGEDTTSINFEVELADPGDSYSFDVDIVNGGSIDAMYKITYDWSTYDDEHPELYIFEVKYKDGMELQENDLLKKNSRETITVTVAYNRDIDIESLPTEDRSVNYNLTLEYEQANIKGSKAQDRERLYTITYDLDGGVNNPSNPSTYTNRTETFTLEDPTKDGYTFTGWTVGKNLYSYDYLWENQVVGTGTEVGTDTKRGMYDVKPNTYYYLSSNLPKRPDGGCYIAINSSDDINVSTKSELHGVYSDLYRKAKSTSNGHIIISYFKSLFTTELTNGLNNGTYWILIEEGYRNTTWEPHISTPTKNIVINSGSDGNRTYKANWQAN